MSNSVLNSDMMLLSVHGIEEAVVPLSSHNRWNSGGSTRVAKVVHYPCKGDQYKDRTGEGKPEISLLPLLPAQGGEVRECAAPGNNSLNNPAKVELHWSTHKHHIQ
jgi:hypothetical protein